MYRLKNLEPQAPEALYTGTELLKYLCLKFGPTGCTQDVLDAVCGQLYGTGADITCDRAGNLFAVVKGGGEGYNRENPLKVMLSSHMDEVGFMVTDTDGDGYLKFSCVGGIDPRVLCGRHVTVKGKDGFVHGIIASKAIHHQTAEERKTATKTEQMYIEIGATGRDDALSCVSVGDWGTFDSEFVLFGEDKAVMKSKAIDDRLGNSVMIETLRALSKSRRKLPFDLIFAFTVREEIGNSGAGMAARRFEPDYAIILEATAIADLPEVPENSRVAEVGKGGVISLIDRGTIYDREFVDGALEIAAAQGIPVQIKKYVSGSNDAAHIHKSACGVKCLAVSNPTRYIHSASNVGAVADYESIKSLVYAVLTGYTFVKENQ